MGYRHHHKELTSWLNVRDGNSAAAVVFQGKAVEYHIESLPPTILNSLQLREDPAQYTTTRQDPLVLWVEAYYHFTEAEREQVITFIFREGAKSLIERLATD